MKKDPIDAWLKPLENIQETEAPAFLFTRITQAVSSRTYECLAPSKVVFAGVAFCLLLLLNVVVLLRNDLPHPNSETTVHSFDLLPDNDLYK